MYRYHHHPLLGTDVTIAIDGVEAEVANQLDQAVTNEIDRLERILTAFDPGSEFERWKRGDVAQPSIELTEVLRSSLDWQIRSVGVFNPLVDEIAALWRESERSGVPPSAAALDDAAARIAHPRLDVDEEGRITAVGDVGALRLHAFAKGWIVDRSIAAALDAVGGFEAQPVLDIVVNAGGDLAHRGVTARPVAIANPLSRFDNAPPVDCVMLCDAGLATSGRSRQGYDVAGCHYSHVIDPRSGQPVDLHASISIVAADAATADVIATIAGVHPTTDAIEVADDYDAACLVVGLDGAPTSNARWDALRRLSAG